MRLETAVQKKLKEVLEHERVYPDAAPLEISRHDKPYVIFLHAGDDEQDGLNGVESLDHRDTFQVEVWGKDRSAVVAQRDKLKRAFRGANCQGTWGGEGGLCVAGAFAKEASGDVAPADDASDRHDRAEVLRLTVIWFGTFGG